MKQYLKIASVLFCICAVAAGLLAGINAITAPQIAANALKETSAALMDISGGFDLGAKREGNGQASTTASRSLKARRLRATSSRSPQTVTAVPSLSSHPMTPTALSSVPR